MKALMLILSLAFFPVLSWSQGSNIPAVSLKTPDAKTVLASSVIPRDELTLIYFFNDNSKDIEDNFEYLQGLSEKYINNKDIKVIAIYNAMNGNYSHLKPFLNGNGFDLDTYVDINGEFQRSLGLSDNSSLLVMDPNMKSTYYYSETIDYEIDIIGREIASNLYNK